MELTITLFVLVLTTGLMNIHTTSAGNTSAVSDHTFISGVAGIDHSSCINNKTSPCQTLEYVFLELKRFITTAYQHDIILLGDLHYLNSTVIVSGIGGLILRGMAGDKHTTVHCAPPSNATVDGGGFRFLSVSNLHIVNLTLEGCGTLLLSTTLRNRGGAMFRSTIYFLNCTHVHIDACEFRRNRGKALSFYNNGHINITKSVFAENAVPEAERLSLFGGGAVLIEYSPGLPSDHNASFVIESCLFHSNKATDIHRADIPSRSQFPSPSHSDSHYLGQGGAITINFKGNSSNNFIMIMNCTFYNNSALFGGGLKLLFDDSATGNHIIIIDSKFVQNRALQRGGGAVELTFALGHGVTDNTFVVHNTDFVDNSGYWGGAVAIWSIPASCHQGNTVTFTNCTWSGNSATIGAAISILVDERTIISGSIAPNITLEHCSFFKNQLIPLQTFHTHGEQAIESGALHVEDFTVACRGQMKFTKNIGSAIYASSARIQICVNSTALFSSNTATHGGAISLVGSSTLHISANTTIVFESNSAEIGGAMSYISQHQTDSMFFYHNCFISYEYEIHPNHWNSSLTFIHNTAKYGSAIYIDSLLPCARHVGSVSNEVFQWKSFKYIPEVRMNTIATASATVSFNLPVELAPGERVNISPQSLDELNQSSAAVYQANIECNSEYTEARQYLFDGYLQVINGTPGCNYTFTLEAIGAHHVSSHRHGTLSNCPIGFKLEDGKCVCFTAAGHELVGVPLCSADVFKSYLQVGYWAGCVGDIPVTAECPTGYCSYPNAIAGLTVLPRSCQNVSQHSVCAANRGGRLCGECKEGHSVFYHSENFKCGMCSNGALGWLIYVTAELIPLCLFFTFIILLRVDLSCGSGQSFTFFVQVVILLSYKSVPHENSSRAAYILMSIFHLLFGPLNLDFFKIDCMSFCLWNGATTLDNLAFKYVTTLVGLILLFSFIYFFKQHSKDIGAKTSCCPRIQQRIKEHIATFNPTIYSIITFLVIFYDRITITSFQILAPAKLYGEGEASVTSVVAVSGDVEYFGKTHLQYALPALLVILFLTIPPPLMLISYPLLWKLKSKCSYNKTAEDEKVCWPIRQFQPLLDSFQGDYRDNYRFFSGLLFIWRIIITAIVAFASNNTYYLLITLTFVIKLFIYGIAAPHQTRFYNGMDMFIIATLLAINTLDWFNYTNTITYHQNLTSANETSAMIKVFLVYLPISFLGLRGIVKQLKVCRLGNELYAGRIFCNEQFFDQSDNGQLNLSSLYAEDSDIDLPVDSPSFSKYT